MIKAAIFDLDGVIVDSEPIHFKAYKAAFAKIGVKLSKKEYMQELVIKGTGTKEALKRHKAKADIRKLREEKAKLFKKLLKNKLKPMPGAKKLLNQLHGKLLIGLASSSHIYDIEHILDSLGIKNKFNAVIASENVKKEKPSPEPFLLAAKRLGVKPPECVVIEDTEKGVKAAKKAKMKCIAVPNQFTKQQDFSKADLVIKSLKEINLQKIKELNKKIKN